MKSFFVTPDGSTKTKTQQYKMKIYTSTEEKLKEKQNQNQNTLYSKASPNGPLNIYVAGMPRKNMID